MNCTGLIKEILDTFYAFVPVTKLIKKEIYNYFVSNCPVGVPGPDKLIISVEI